MARLISIFIKSPTTSQHALLERDLSISACNSNWCDSTRSLRRGVKHNKIKHASAESITVRCTREDIYTTGNHIAAVSQVFCREFFCQAHGTLAFCRRQKLKLTANRAAHGNTISPRGAHGKDVVCREPFVADDNKLFCRERLTVKM
jgi:hypothetical protein